MQTDYTHSKTAPVLVCFIRHRDKFLLLKRSDKVLGYKNLWSSLAAFIDDEKTIENKIAEEIQEELGLEKEDIKRIVKGDVYTFKDEDLGRDWIRHLCLVEISNPDIKLDWEHTDYKWITPGEAADFQTTPGFAADLEKVKLL